VRLPRDISPGARARRSLLSDLFAGLLLALSVILLCAGIGVVGAIALLSLLILISWFAIEGLARLARRSSKTRRR
jgi:Na+-transporting methylmalonyl-CoA/oxaloacetate decarboxylase gamma subunit